MFRYKLLAFMVTFVCATTVARADELVADAGADASAPVKNIPAAPAPAVKKASNRRPSRTLSRTEIGVGYLTWTEDFAVSSAAGRSHGVSSYGGAALFVEQSWFLKRWQLGINAAIGSGKAAADVSGDVTYSDGTNRAWTSEMIEPFARYAINAYFLMGAGLVYRHTSITWDSADTTLSLDPHMTNVTGQFDFKCIINRHWSIGQGYAPLGFKARSLWFTTASYAF